MLNSLRIAANNIFFRILLILIVLAFALWGIGDVIRGRNDFDIVKFRKLPNITLSNFYQSKQEAIRYLEENSKEKISDEMLEAMNLDKQILSDLISRRMVEAWINSENIAISDKIVARNIRKIPEFADEQKNFNFELFKKYISRLSISEEEFYENFKYQFAKDLLISTTKQFITMPSMLENIMIDHMIQVKRAKYIAVNLIEQNNLPNIVFSDEDLKKFYEENKDIFKLPEERTVNYIIISNKTSQKNEDATKEFVDLNKKLEDEVAAGENITEIAKTYKTEVKSIAGNLDFIMQNQQLSNHAEQIFSMNEAEVAYPLELKDNKGLILFEISKITKDTIPDFLQIKNQVQASYIRKTLISENIKKLKEFEEKSTMENFEDLAKTFGFILKIKDFERSIPDNEIFPEVRETFLSTNLNELSSLIILEDKAYIGKIEKIFTNQKQAEIVRKNSLKKIQNEYKSSLIDEIIEYFYNRNIPDIKIELLGG